MAREPVTPVSPIPPVDGPEKLSPQAAPAAGTPIVETAAPTLDRRTGEPVSAEVRPQPVRRRGVVEGGPLDALRAATMPDPRNAGTLPATGRVLPGGSFVGLGGPADEGRDEEREFTAAVRIMRDETLYEVGAPVPLTRAEFEDKREAGAVVERSWVDGLPLAG